MPVKKHAPLFIDSIDRNEKGIWQLISMNSVLEAKQSHRAWEWEKKHSETRGMRWAVVEDWADLSPRSISLNLTEGWETFAWNLTPPSHHLKKKKNTSKKVRGGKKQTKKLLDNKVNMCKEAGPYLACEWKSHQIWKRIDNRTYNHKSIMHTRVAYNVWQHSTVHCTRGSLSDNEIQNSG